MTAYISCPEFRTKKALKGHVGKNVTVVIPDISSIYEVSDYTGPIVGPGPYKRKWYARIKVENSTLIEVM